MCVLCSPTDLTSVRVSEPRRSVRGIAALVVSPDKRYVAAAESMADGYAPQITIFDASTLEVMASVQGPNVAAPYHALCFSSKLAGWPRSNLLV